MANIQLAAQDTWWIGANDRRTERFENIFPLPKGVTYNSYVIRDEKTALFDTCDVSVSDRYMDNLTACLDGTVPDYLIILHMEPDHCSMIASVVQRYPSITLVGSAKTFQMLQQFFPLLPETEKLTVGEGDTLSLGKHTLHFITAPMVHWPEVLMAYDDLTKALFTADAFGTFGTLSGSIFADDYDFEAEFLSEARRYYANIVGKYGPQVQAVLKKAAALEIGLLLPLHGPVWRKDIDRFIGWYQLWSTYEPEEDSILVVYGSLYGHTAAAAETAAVLLREETGKPVRVFDVSGTHVSDLIGEVWRAGTIVLFCPTYNMGIYPPMENFLADMAALNVQKRRFAVAQNGSWAPASGKLICEKLAGLRNCTVSENILTIKSALSEADTEALQAFVRAVNE